MSEFDQVLSGLFQMSCPVALTSMNTHTSVTVVWMWLVPWGVYVKGVVGWDLCEAGHRGGLGHWCTQEQVTYSFFFKLTYSCESKLLRANQNLESPSGFLFWDLISSSPTYYHCCDIIYFQASPDIRPTVPKQLWAKGTSLFNKIINHGSSLGKQTKTNAPAIGRTSCYLPALR